MSFCPNCKKQVDPDASFCPSCRTVLKAVEPAATAQVSMKERGGALEDSIADYFRRMGFDVQSRVRMRDRSDVSHEIDVLASRREAFGTIQVAVECKYVKAPIDIKEVRNFHDKLSTLGITKGIFVSTGGFTADAEMHARSFGIELWDMKTLTDKVAESEIPQKDVIRDALPISPTAIDVLSPRHLKNSNIFSEALQLNYRPYYFLDFHCFSQHMVAGNSVILESKGKVVMDGVSGLIVDSEVSTGLEPSLPKNGPYVRCLDMQSETVTSTSLPMQLSPSIVGAEVDAVSAKNLAKMELVKNISFECRYLTTRTAGKKLLKPRKKDVDITDVRPVKIPFVTGTYHFKDRMYTRAVLASTGGIISDQTTSCTYCPERPVLACENCGAIACESHSKNCVVCGKNLCNRCVTSKGIFSKKYYCAEHKPED
jgi:hypothetical protein